MKQKTQHLKSVYDAFDEKTAAYRRDAACAKSCAFCCTAAGSIDIITLEGLVINEYIFMLNTPRFLDTYLAGDFKTEEIMDFGKTHKIVINRMVINITSSG